MTHSGSAISEMTVNLLFEHFATLATAPNGIARLRELILQLAVQGKLGTQDVGDEPALKLVERIRKEKERLVKEGTIKKDKPLKISNSEDPPGHLPKTWVWTRLSEVGLVNPRNYDIADDVDVSFIPMTLIPVGYKKPAQQEIKKWGEIKAGFTHFADNDVVMAKITPCFQNGKSVVLRNLKNGVGAGTTELHVFRSIKNLMNPEFVLLFLKTPEFLETGIRRMTGSAGQKRVPNEYFSEIPFPLPPLAEQNRIVAKVDRFMTICDELEAQQQQERAGCLRLGTASLAGLQNAESPEKFGRQWVQVCDAFDLILDCPENVKVLRQTILQLAVQGRLVRQEPGDEPADLMINRFLKNNPINNKKKINDKKMDIPSKLPRSWAFRTLGSIIYFAGRIGWRGLLAEEYTLEGPLFFSAHNLSERKYADLSKSYHIPIERYEESPEIQLQNHDILLVKDGSGIGKIGLINDLTEKATINSSLLLIRANEIIDPEFLYFQLGGPGLQKIVHERITGSATPHLFQKDIKNFSLVIPPIAEQHRIVAKVNALMALCDALESRLKERAAIQTKFTDAIVKNVGTG